MISPSIVLSSQFVVSSISNKSFSNYMDYMDHVEVLELRGSGADTYIGSKNRDELSAIKDGLAN